MAAERRQGLVHCSSGQGGQVLRGLQFQSWRGSKRGCENWLEMATCCRRQEIFPRSDAQLFTFLAVTKKTLADVVPMQPDDNITCVEEYNWSSMRSRMSPGSSRTVEPANYS